VTSAQRKDTGRQNWSGQAGFTLMEVMISIFVLTVGLVSLLGVFGVAMAATQTSQQDLIAKQLASEAMESIITARNTSQLSWAEIQNSGTGQTPDGIFVNGTQPIDKSGADGIIGTADDMTGSNSGPATLTLPGPDGIVGTADDVTLPLTNYTRQIQIAAVTDSSGNVSSTLRMATITVRYRTPMNRTKNYVLNSYISEYR